MLLCLVVVPALGALVPSIRYHSSHAAIKVPVLQRALVRASIDGQDDVRPHARLILVRHGQSEWNLANRFTGWVDVDLTEEGILEARAAGQILASEGIYVDEVHTSYLRRAIRSVMLMLSTLNQCWVAVHKNPALNEQHSGFLTGQNKLDLSREFGVDQVMAWRRRFDELPPPLAEGSGLQAALCTDSRYDEVGVPTAESLAIVCDRVQPVWERTILPSLREGKTVLEIGRAHV